MSLSKKTCYVLNRSYKSWLLFRSEFQWMILKDSIILKTHLSLTNIVSNSLIFSEITLGKNVEKDALVGSTIVKTN